jgi:hypothetical protein
MKKYITAVLLLPLAMFTYAQEETFIYKQTKHGLLLLISESDTVKLTKYRPGETGELNRTVKMGGEQYLISISNAGDPTKRLIDADGKILATVSMGPKSRYDILMADGAVLDYTMDRKTWWYTLDGIVIMRGTLRRENAQNKVVISNVDFEAASPALWLACLERGSEKYKSSAKTATVLLPVAGLAVLLALSSILDL